MVKKRLGLSIEKDGGYSKLLVGCSAMLSGFTFGLAGYQGVLTAHWKAEYGFPQDTASYHQTYSQAFLYFGSMILSLFYKRLQPRYWLIISTVLGLIGYFSIYFATFLPINYFPAMQIFMGVTVGLGAGLSFGIICITPQHWLDKTREFFNPYLFIGAPIFVTICTPIGLWLIGIYSWSGAHLILIGFFFQQVIVTALFDEHYTEKTKNTDNALEELKKKPKEIWTTATMNGVLPMLFNCAVCSGFIMSGVFTQVQNVAMEEGLTVWEAGTLIMFSSIPEIFFRPLWGFLTKRMSVGTLQIIWCAIFVVSQFLLSIATSYWMFIAGMMCFSLGLAGYSGLKFVIFINLVGCDLLPNALIFDTFLDAIMTIIVPTVSNYFAVTTGDSKIIFYVNCGAAALCILSSFVVRWRLNQKEEKEKDEKSKELVHVIKAEDGKTD